METSIEELDELLDVDMRVTSHKADRVEEDARQINIHMQVLKAMKEWVSKFKDLKEELERKQGEVDDLDEQLEQKDKAIDDLRRQLQAETDDLRQQLLEAKNLHLESKNQHLESENLHLESEKQHLKAEASAKPREIHNHFEPGSSAQVFNAKVTSKFIKNKDKRDKKKRWKKIARKIL